MPAADPLVDDHEDDDQHDVPSANHGMPGS